MSNTTRVSTAADFRKIHEQQTAQDAEPLTLPSGLRVLAHRPSPDWWIRHLGRLPQGLAVRASSQAADAPTPTTDEIIEFSQYTIAIISEVIVSPKVRNKPGPNDIDPHWITDKDFQFLLQYARGEIVADGSSLDRFSGRSPSAPSGADRETVGSEAQ
jgi:hypothetical protein